MTQKNIMPIYQGVFKAVAMTAVLGGVLMLSPCLTSAMSQRCSASAIAAVLQTMPVAMECRRDAALPGCSPEP
ncbi:MAG: hypothetical protein GAK30_01770 [Paracidovorax wautersii]|uniref:Uncharacterized protein n=1 Tax=Paracidovorax wautersii TaxID=1177982 RepID=A0A7V8JQS1_9BURK|nr:MAG: hypothetical protein GAK30_01770 [Paracidovorax wautersii]